MSADASDTRQGRLVNALSWSLTILSMIFVTARIVSRTKLANNAGLDDLFISLAAFFDVLYSALISAAVRTGTGQHLALISPSDLSKAIIVSDVALCVGIFAITVPKLAIAFLLKRVFNPRPAVTFVIVSGGVLINLLGVAIVFVIFFECTPAAGQWNPKIPAKCLPSLNTLGTSIFAQAFSAFLDLCYAAYPAARLLKLQMPRSRKIGISILMGVGVFAAFTAIYKATKLPSFTNKADFTYSSAQLNIWSIVEANVLIIAACIPTIGPFIQATREKLSSLTTTTLTTTTLQTNQGRYVRQTDGNTVGTDNVRLVKYSKDASNPSM